LIQQPEKRSVFDIFGLLDREKEHKQEHQTIERKKVKNFVTNDKEKITIQNYIEKNNKSKSRVIFDILTIYLRDMRDCVAC